MSSVLAPKSPVISSPSLFSTADLTTSFCPRWASYPSSSVLLPALFLSWNHPEVIWKTIFYEKTLHLTGVEFRLTPSQAHLLFISLIPWCNREGAGEGDWVEMSNGSGEKKQSKSAGLQQIHCHRPALDKSLFCLDRGHIAKRGQIVWSSVVWFRMEAESVGCQRGTLYTPDKSRSPPPCSSTSSHRHHTYCMVELHSWQ